MGLTITNCPADNTFQATIALPDSGTSVSVTGCCNPSGVDGLTDTAFTGSPLTAPTPPGSGIINWLIEFNTSTGALDILQNTTPGTFPTNTAGCQTIFQQTLSPGQTDPSLNNTDVTPDV